MSLQEENNKKAVDSSENKKKLESVEKYEVLARKYRPKDFNDLIGQEALVQTLTNSIKAKRLAHAYILTGVRGIGKTSTARIIAKALNCLKNDENNPIVNPCGECENCQAIAQDRHVDVLEMDAASRTGVSDIREILEGVRYKPTSAKYKIYIIDEVHMLSKSAFNALLKTLEEPPEHVKFIFATTEIRKVPVTVLSRCQRFDLRRVDTTLLSEHFEKIAKKENAKIDKEALKLIAKAADGSVRDGLSLLDQAIAHTAGEVDASKVRDMIGLADRIVIFELFDEMMQGNVSKALEIAKNQYSYGSDPVVIVSDLLELNHWLTKIKIIPDLIDDPSVSQNEKDLGLEISKKLNMGSLTKIWQLLLKGLEEIQKAPSAFNALEMLIVRICYSADMPNPKEIIEQLKKKSKPNLKTQIPKQEIKSDNLKALIDDNFEKPQEKDKEEKESQEYHFKNFVDILNFLQQKNNGLLSYQFMNDLHPISFDAQNKEMTVSLEKRAEKDFIVNLRKFIKEHTGQNWVVNIKRDNSSLTLQQRNDIERKKNKEKVSKNPLVKEVLDMFPNSKIETLTPKTDILQEIEAKSKEE